MSAPEQDEDRETVVETVDEEELYGPSEELLENVSAALAESHKFLQNLALTPSEAAS